jgi:hypothetical protein
MPEETEADNAATFQAGVRMGIPVMVPGVFRDGGIGRIADLFLFDNSNRTPAVCNALLSIQLWP